MSVQAQKIDTAADKKIRQCIEDEVSFSVVAGAGSGKTTSLVDGLSHIRTIYGREFRRDGKQVVCVTYTNRAVAVLESKLLHDDLFCISTIHGFLWDQIFRFQGEIRKCVLEYVIPYYIDKKSQDDNGKNSIKARKARQKIAQLEYEMKAINTHTKFKYENVSYSRFSDGALGHDDIILIASQLICNNTELAKIIGQKYPILFVDEAQDTFPEVIQSLNSIAAGNGFPIVAYFGDPMQQIFDNRAGDFSGPDSFVPIFKEENFRSSKSVIALLNSFRDDLQQKPIDEGRDIGSVEIRLIQAEVGEGARKAYTLDQLARVTQRFDEALDFWGWNDGREVKRLFLVRQMIARRQGFPTFNKLFTGPYASQTAENDYRDATHFLIAPFRKVIAPLFAAYDSDNMTEVIKLLRTHSSSFRQGGELESKSVGEVMKRVEELVGRLCEMWSVSTMKEILVYCAEHGIVEVTERLAIHLEREPRAEEYDEGEHSLEKSDWLVDEFFTYKTEELSAYMTFIEKDTPYSTQHGVKGEQYKNVLAVFDDTEARWNNYSFSKTLTPDTAGVPTDGQQERSKKIAYVCFSRAKENLRIILFSSNPDEARRELLEKGLFEELQISVG